MKTKYVSELTGLRGLSVLLVLTAHTPARHLIGDFGQEAVYIFFFLSAFLLTISLEKQTVKEYAIKRFWRIYPLYALIITFLTVITSVAVSNYILNLLFLQGLNDSFILDVSWTLIVEIQLYILLPLIVKYLKKFKWQGLLIVVIICYLLRIVNFEHYYERVANGSMRVVDGNIFEFLDMFCLASYIAINRHKLKTSCTSTLYPIILLLIFFFSPYIIEALKINRALAIIAIIIPLYTILIAGLFIYIQKKNIIMSRIFSNKILIFYG